MGGELASVVDLQKSSGLDGVRRYPGQYIDAQTTPRAISERRLGTGPTPLPFNHSIAEAMIEAAAARMQSQIQSPAKTNVVSKLKGSKPRRAAEKTNKANMSEQYARSFAQRGSRLEGVAETVLWSTPTTR
jgi:hypothetical protein